MAGTLVDVIGTTVLACWLILTAAVQTGARRWRWLARLNMFPLIPNWQFFAPHPGMHDYHVLYRDLLANGSVSCWTELPQPRPRSLLAAAWNPAKRHNKALFDLATVLLRTATECDELVVKTSVPYISILNYISELPRSHLVVGRQFILMATFAAQPPRPAELLFLSGFHEC
jgi:hypothetical protein